MSFRQRPSWRKLRASLRDTWLLFREFQWPLLIFTIAILGGGLLYFGLANRAGEPINNRSEAIYHVLGLTFLSPGEDFPKAWYLEIFYFVMPIIGIGILAQGMGDFGVSLFNRNERSKEWEMAVAATFNRHVVLVGLGHLGFRVANHLYEMGQDVVVIEMNPKADLVSSVRAQDIPVIVDDATREVSLQAAGIEKARAIILCTQEDSLNLQVALKARTLNDVIEVVVRIFDDDFAQALEKQFGFRALSATGTASPVFAAAAAGVDMTRPITVEGQAFSLASVCVAEIPTLAGKTVCELEDQFEISIVLLRRGADSDFHPAGDREILKADTLAILGASSAISSLVQR
jgi:voltage-gated potassium channel